MNTNDFEKLNLKKIDITGNVLGKFATFAIQQKYTNNTDAVLEVTYTFPISATATVTGCYHRRKDYQRESEGKMV